MTEEYGGLGKQMAQDGMLTEWQCFGTLKDLTF
jgi:hypothetical protein